MTTLSASSGPPYSQGGTGKYGFESDLKNGDDNSNDDDNNCHYGYDNGHGDGDDTDNNDSIDSYIDFTIYWRIQPAC